MEVVTSIKAFSDLIIVTCSFAKQDIFRSPYMPDLWQSRYHCFAGRLQEKICVPCGPALIRIHPGKMERGAATYTHTKRTGILITPNSVNNICLVKDEIIDDPSWFCSCVVDEETMRRLHIKQASVVPKRINASSWTTSQSGLIIQAEKQQATRIV